MFASARDQSDNIERPSSTITGEFAISFSRMPDQSYLLCKHDIGRNAVIGKGIPIGFDVLEQAIAAIKEQRQKASEEDAEVIDPIESGWVQNVLYSSDKTLIWYRASTGKTEKIWFRHGDGVCVDALFPTIVFVLNKNTGELRLFASTQKNPTRKSRLYHAPLCNVNSAGSLCFGNADRPNLSASIQSIIRVSESAVFDSMFSHVNHKMTFASDKAVETTDHIRYWQQLSKSGRMPKSKDMVKTNFTIEQLVAG